MRMTDKNVIVTGAARSIGRAVAERFAEEGANVAILDVLEEQGLVTAAEIAKKYSVKATFYTCDVG